MTAGGTLVTPQGPHVATPVQFIPAGDGSGDAGDMPGWVCRDWHCWALSRSDGHGEATKGHPGSQRGTARMSHSADHCPSLMGTAGPSRDILAPRGALHGEEPLQPLQLPADGTVWCHRSWRRAQPHPGSQIRLVAAAPCPFPDLRLSLRQLRTREGSEFLIQHDSEQIIAAWHKAIADSISRRVSGAPESPATTLGPGPASHGAASVGLRHLRRGGGRNSG